ncbi:hypothetical protein FACS1894159_10370 [Bacteroidia bacterium]|nr:hypothetical protein FACS1894159_10370 [Bacteroidia bacterium]
MRKVPYIILLAAISLTACHKDKTTTPPVDPAEVSFEATAGASSSSGATEEFVWVANSDRIGVFAVSGGTAVRPNLYFPAYSSSATSFFTAPAGKELFWSELAAPGDFLAYFPWRSGNDDPTAIPVAVKAAQSGAADDANILKKAAALWASARNVALTGGCVPLIFRSIAGLIRLDLTSNRKITDMTSLTVASTDGSPIAFEAGTFDLTDGSLTPDATSLSGQITFTFTEPASFSPTKTTSVYIAVAPGLAGKQLDLSAMIGGSLTSLGTVTISTSGITAGEMATFTVAHDILDLSTDLSATGTANTYIVNAAATTYRFNATVKGNGVARSYGWSYDGSPITKAYSDIAIDPTEAKLVWYNSPKAASGWVHTSPVVIESVELENGYVYFETPATFTPGNVLLAAYDNGGNILWSWNIWAVEGYDPDATAASVGRFTMMDRNLGAIKGADARTVTDAREAAWAIGNYYQWGRKDPFPAASEYNNESNNIGGTGTAAMEWGLPTYTPVDALKKDCSTASWGSTDMMFSNTYTQNVYSLQAELGGANFPIESAVAASVKYPYKWMASGAGQDCAAPSYMWMVQNNLLPANEQTDWRYLWGSVDGANSDKSIYDPCPPGWKVPTAEVYGCALDQNAIALSSNEYGVYNSKYGLYFPYAGQRTAAFGGSKIAQLKAKGDLFIATATATAPNNPIRANKSAIAGNSMTAGNSYAGAGYQVRCVKEAYGSPAPGGTQSGPNAVFMGNSITEQWPIRGRIAFFTDNNYVGKGISGHTTANMLERFCADVLALDPRCTLIAAGTNDMAENGGYHVTTEDILNNTRIMAYLARSYGMKVVIGAICPADNMWWKDVAWQAANNPTIAQRIADYNVVLKAWALSEGFAYADYFSVLKNPGDNALQLQYQFGGNDAVHPNGAGYAVMEPVAKKAVNAALYPGGADQSSDQLKDFNKWNGW